MDRILETMLRREGVLVEPVEWRGCCSGIELRVSWNMVAWAELCAESSLSAVSDDALAARVFDLAAAGSVLVGVAAADRGAARRALPDDVTLVTLTDLDASSLDEAAMHVFAVDGRCVVLARRGADGWDARITAGAWGSTAVGAAVSPPASPRVRSAPEPARDAWIGGGVTLGFPSLLAGFASVRLGPLVGEVALGPFVPLLIDAYARAGPMLAVGRPPADKPAVAIGVLAGATTWGTLFNGWSGTTVVAAVDVYRTRGDRTGYLFRVTAGVDLWTSSYDIQSGPRDELGVVPRLQFGVGAVVLP